MKCGGRSENPAKDKEEKRQMKCSKHCERHCDRKKLHSAPLRVLPEFSALKVHGGARPE